MNKKEIEKAVKRVLKEYRPVFELLAEDWDSPLELSEEAQDILIKTGEIDEEEAKEIKELRKSIKEAEEGKTKPLSDLSNISDTSEK